MEAFTDVTKLVESFGLEEVSQYEDCRQISLSIILMSHDLSQPIRIVASNQREIMRYRWPKY